MRAAGPADNPPEPFSPEDPMMITSLSARRLQAAADTWTLRAGLRFASIFTILWGGLAIVAGLIPPMQFDALGLGLILLAAGIWNRVRVAPSGIVIDAAAILLVGLYNIVVSILPVTEGTAAGFGFWARVGVFQIVMGIQMLGRYPAYRDATLLEVSDPDVASIGERIKALTKAKAKQTTDVVEFVSTGFLPKAWKARLEPEGALFLTEGGRVVKVAGRGEVRLTIDGVEKPGKTNPAVLTVGASTMKIQIK
ncbi:MAG TPA: hypothetical protein VKA21_13260, partial [Candidatus Binatia bacterium]|nr:hypothetical protein [Candidatus Binatia bacterium]